MKREDTEKEKEKVRENIIRELKKRYDIDTIEELKEMNKKLKLNIGVFTKWYGSRKNTYYLVVGKIVGNQEKKLFQKVLEPSEIAIL